MTHNTIQLLFYISLGVGLPAGLLVFVWWAKKVWKRIANTKIAAINIIAMRTLFYLFPGLLMIILFCIPCLYFGYLLKQENYCKQLIEVNKGITRENAIIQQRCSSFDLDELFNERK